METIQVKKEYFVSMGLDKGKRKIKMETGTHDKNTVVCTVENENDFECENTAIKIATSLNATYGKGINPESVEAMLDFIKNIAHNCTASAEEIKEANELIESASL